MLRQGNTEEISGDGIARRENTRERITPILFVKGPKAIKKGVLYPRFYSVDTISLTPTLPTSFARVPAFQPKLPQLPEGHGDSTF